MRSGVIAEHARLPPQRSSSTPASGRFPVCLVRLSVGERGRAGRLGVGPPLMTKGRPQRPDPARSVVAVIVVVVIVVVVILLRDRNERSHDAVGFVVGTSREEQRRRRSAPPPLPKAIAQRPSIASVRAFRIAHAAVEIEAPEMAVALEVERMDAAVAEVADQQVLTEASKAVGRPRDAPGRVEHSA